MTTTKHSDPISITLPRERTLTTGSATHIEPTTFSPRVLVIGAALAGLVTSWVLLDRGYQVTIFRRHGPTIGPTTV
jgi:D-amino-acid oxidase